MVRKAKRSNLMRNNIRSLLLVSLITVLSGIPLQVFAAEHDAVLEWKHRVELSTFVTGVIDKINVNPGDQVKKGDTLIALDDRLLKSQLEKAGANLERWQKLHDEAKRELDRNTELYDRTVLSDHELEVARIGLAEAAANLKAAEAEKVEAETNLQNSQIKAPFDGIVIQLNASIGQTIVNAETANVLAIVAETGTMVANATLSFDVIKSLKLGQTIPVTVEGSRYLGKVLMIGFEPVAGTGKKYSVLIEFSINTKLLRAGQKATVKI